MQLARSLLVVAVLAVAGIQPTQACDGCPRVVSVTVSDQANGSLGSGVLVTRDKEQFVWTAGHVVASLRAEDGTFAEATVFREVFDGERKAGGIAVNATVVAYSPQEEDDLAFLKVLGGTPFGDVSTQFTDDKPLWVGACVLHIGSMLGLHHTVTRGTVANLDREILGKKYDVISIATDNGSSGGGVFSSCGERSGQLVGLVIRNRGGLAFIIPVRRMRAWAKDQKLEWAVKEADPIKTPEVK